MDTKGRWWFGLTALAVLVGLVVQVPVTAGVETGFFDSPAKRADDILHTIGRSWPSWGG